jgi:nucleoside-diphosphate-sugar epimerase
MSKRIVLVTGATGFVGSAIANQCQGSGLTVRTTGRAAGSPLLPPNYFQADLTNPAALQGLVADVEVIIHAAGVAHQFGKNKFDVEIFQRGNVEATKNIVQAAAARGVRHFILVSSVSVYGDRHAGMCAETPSCFPSGPYAESKLQAEQRAFEIAAPAGMALTVLRLATVYGEGDPGNVARLMRTIDRGQFLWVGSGTNHKSLIHRDDVARACLAVLQSSPQGIGVYNVTAEMCTMREVVEGLAQALGRRLPSWRIPSSPILCLSGLASGIVGGRGRLGALHGAVKKWLADDCYDGNKFWQTFRFQPRIGLAEGLRREVEWYRRMEKKVDVRD